VIFLNYLFEFERIWACDYEKPLIESIELNKNWDRDQIIKPTKTKKMEYIAHLPINFFFFFEFLSFLFFFIFIFEEVLKNLKN